MVDGDPPPSPQRPGPMTGPATPMAADRPGGLVTVPSDSMVDARTYVLDTSVLLADPQALQRFDEHAVVLPIVVLMELEGKRNHPELGWAARTALRQLEHLRLEHGEQLLRHTEMSVKEVAAACGFADPRQFSRLWTRERGCPPGVFKINARKSG